MTTTGYQPIADLLRRVRRRWTTLRALHAARAAALAAAAAIAAALVAARLVSGRSPWALMLVGLSALVACAAAVARGAWSQRHVPDDRQVARFIEERAPSLDDRLASAVDIVESERGHASPALVGPMLADSAARAAALDPAAIVSDEAIRRAAFQAGGALLVVAVLAIVAAGPARDAYDAAALALFPGRVTLDVTPGNARVQAGTSFEVAARLRGNRAPVLARVEATAGERARTIDMAKEGAGFHASMGAVNASFKYRVVAGAAVSPEYAVAVVRPPRVQRIDVDYTYPPSLGLKPRTEEDSGDVYAPAGTAVRLRVRTDRAAARAGLTLGDGRSIPLAGDSPTTFSTSFTLTDDNSYRVALADAEGLANAGDTEYFMRVLEDRPPEVRILKPAADRAVTRLEEVDVEAQADDDYGLARMDLVYSVRGGAEQVVPLPIPARATSATARHTLALEDLHVQPGDLISYYVRARDITRGTRVNETKSDIYFLEVRPYEQEFTLAQSAAMSGAAGGSIDDLVAAQKQVVVATWKLDRRAQSGAAARSEQDIRSVSRAESDLKSRVEQTSSTFRESTMRDPRRRPAAGAPRAGETMPEEDDMTAASAAMGKAVGSLDALKTSDALPPEMEALNRLLKAQADVKKREVSRQQAGNGAGNSNRNYDMSTLFDKELQKQTETNYENRSGDTSREESAENALDKIQALARRQDELTKAQQELANERASLGEEELKRQLERLTREQSQLRQEAEDLAQQMNGRQAGARGSQKGDSPRGQAQGQSSSGAAAAGASQAGAERAKAMRDVSDEMRSAASELRRQDPGEASSRGTRALEKLRALARQLQDATPEQRRRALGEAQLEARQLADAERQLSDDLHKAAAGSAGDVERRRVAGEQQRLADRTRKLQDGLKQQGESDASGELERQRLADEMGKAADALRGAGADPKRQNEITKAQQGLARSLDKVADALGAATGTKDAEAGKLSSQLGRAQELREKMQRLSDEVQRLGKQDGRGSNQPSAQKTPGSEGRSGEGQSAGGGSGTDLAKLRQEYERELKQTQELMNELRRDDPNFSRGGAGFTYEGQGMTLSAPGTEAFKQDFAKWEQLRLQATQALDAAETTLSKKLQAKQAHDRLAAGVDDKAPPEYQKQVDTYFKSLAAKKKGG